jgi:hypothetical protein
VVHGGHLLQRGLRGWRVSYSAISGDGNYLLTAALYFGFLLCCFLFLEFSFRKFVDDFSGIIGLFMAC